MDNTMQGNGGGKGALFGVIVIILLLVAGGLYLGFKNTTPEAPITPIESTVPGETQSLSASIEADLNNSDLQTIDDDVADINAAIAQ